MVSALSGGPKGFHFGDTFGTICELHLSPFLAPDDVGFTNDCAAEQQVAAQAED